MNPENLKDKMGIILSHVRSIQKILSLFYGDVSRHPQSYTYPNSFSKQLVKMRKMVLDLEDEIRVARQHEEKKVIE